MRSYLCRLGYVSSFGEVKFVETFLCDVGASRPPP